MSLRIQQLNADTTFLLTFSPPWVPEKLSTRYPGDFTILIDPWLRGHSSILHPTFQISHHTSTPALRSLEELMKWPDLILISQSKPDHCHRETLCSLPKDSDAKILATPAAAKKICSWQHFDADQVHTINPYKACNPDTIVRIPISAYSRAGAAGEITIANVPAKRDVTGVHNAICVTYQPPSTVLTPTTPKERKPWASTVSLPMPTSSSLRSRRSSSRNRRRPRTTSNTMPQRPSFLDPLGLKPSTNNPDSPTTPSPPYFTHATTSPFHHKPPSTAKTNNEPVLSVIYTPHGLSSAFLAPYIYSHLASLDALPISALFHSLNVEENPWFMGGTIASGAPGGLEIAKGVGINYWLGAHDEVKDNRGVATKMIKSRQYAVGEVRSMLDNAGLRETKVYRLDVGEVLRIPEGEATLEEARKKSKRRSGEGLVNGTGLTMSPGQRMNVEDNTLAMPEPAANAGAEKESEVVKDSASVAPGTKERIIRRKITHPEGMWI